MEFVGAVSLAEHVDAVWLATRASSYKLRVMRAHRLLLLI